MKKLIFNFISLIFLIILFYNCSSSNSEIKTTELTNNIKQLPVGTAQICGIIQNVKVKSDFFLTLIRVDTVFGYGQSTPPLVVGKSLNTNISKRIVADSEEKFQIKELLNLNSLVYLELEYQNILSLGNKAQNQWSVTKISLNKIF